MTRKTPGVYVRDLSLPQPLDPVLETALPAIIGYTEMAVDAKGNDLTGRPLRVSNLEEYEFYFGGRFHSDTYHVSVDWGEPGGVKPERVEIPKRFYLYECLLHFYENGGGDCFIVSVGNYGDVISLSKDLNTGASGLIAGLEILRKFDEPTLLLFPDAVDLKDASGEPDVNSLGQLQMKALQQCEHVKNRFLIADIIPGNEPDRIETSLSAFRQEIGINNLKYGAVYYPWLYSNFDTRFHFRELIFGTRSDSDVFEEISDIGQFSSSESSEDAQKHRELLNAVRRVIDNISRMLTLVGISNVTRKNLQNWPGEFELRLHALLETPSLDEQRSGFATLLAFVRNTALAFSRLDRNVTQEIQQSLINLRRADRIPDKIEALIAYEKRDDVLAWIGEGRDIAKVNNDYAELNGTWWIKTASVEDIQAETVESTPEPDTVARITANLQTIGVALSEIFSDLFEAAATQEALAETRLFTEHPFFQKVAALVDLELKKLPPSGAMAGIYNATDLQKGVWKAPANVAVSATLGPVIPIDDRGQEDLNVHYTGKSVNAIRTFRGRGTRVWGARTLAGNDLEWRYVPVRRFFNYVESFIKKTTEPFVFESNDAMTWMQIRMLIDNFLTAHWRKGALSGSTTSDAFFVKIGLGETMTSTDVLEGRLIVEVGIAVARPAEFIVVRYICHIQEPG